jgi:Uma2 family endonuclease
MTDIAESPAEAQRPDGGEKLAASGATMSELIAVSIKERLAGILGGIPDVFVGVQLPWYPVELRPEISITPDVLVAFGRPRGNRCAYRQWEEGDIAPQVVLDVVPRGQQTEVIRRATFYQNHGVTELMMWDPHTGEFFAMRRDKASDLLMLVDTDDPWRSPRLGVRFEPNGKNLAINKCAVEPIKSYAEIVIERDAAELRAKQERQRADRLASQLRAMGVEPDAG